MKNKRLLYRILLWVTVSILTTILLAMGFLYTFKDKIIATSISEINKHLNAKIEIDPSIDLSLFEKFPQVSLGFNNIKIYESLPDSKKLLGQSEKLFLTFNILNILDGKYIINQIFIENGSFQLKVNKEGEVNYNIFKPSQGNTSSKGIDLTNISVKNVLVSYTNESNEQIYEVLSKELIARFTIAKDIYAIKLEGLQTIKSINIHNQTYFENKDILINSALTFDDINKELKILPTTFSVFQSTYNIEGFYSFKNENQVDLKIVNNKGEIQDLLSLLPQSFSKPFLNYKSEGEVFFNATIKGIISETENAAVRVNFGCKDASFYHPDLKQKITKANFNGTFSNGDEHSSKASSLKLENINFVLDNNTIVGNFSYSNFDNPFISFHTQGKLNATAILNFYKIQSIKSATGNIDFTVQFDGLLNDLKTKSGHTNINTSGNISISNLTLSLDKIANGITNTSGAFTFTKNEMNVENFKTNIGHSDIALQGSILNLFGALFLKQGKLVANLNMKSSTLEVEELLRFVSDQSDNASDSTAGDFSYLDKYLIRLTVDINKLLYKKVQLSNLKGDIRIDQPNMVLDNISMGIAEGNIKLSSHTMFKGDDVLETSITSQLYKLKIDLLMSMFEDFGQTFITYSNLKGSISGSVETAFNWAKTGEINTESIVAVIDCSIENGELIHFEPMQNLARFIDAEELNHIKFSELKNKLFIKNRIISIPEMQIISNVSDITISGSHSFDNDMDYKLAIPLKNIKKPKIDKDAAFGAIEEDNRKGTTIYLTIKGNVDNYKIAYDTKRTKTKVAEDIKKEKQEFINLFKKKDEKIQETIKPNEEEFFEFDD